MTPAVSVTGAEASGVRLVVAGPTDREWLFDVHRRAFRQFVEARFGPWDNAFQRRLFDGQDERNVAEIVLHGGSPAGAVYWRVDDDGALLVDLIEILPEYQERGLGAAALRELQRRAGARQPVRLRVRKDNRARALYERCGFRAVASTSTHLVMRWDAGRSPSSQPAASLRELASPPLVRELAAAIESAAGAPGMARVIVGIDGCGGAGKSTVARLVSDELGGAPIVQTDAFASWDNPIDWWPRLVEQVLEPIKSGHRPIYQRYDWVTRGLGEWVEVPDHAVLVVEGVSSTRRELRPYLAYRIWVDCPRTIRLQRGIARDGVHMLAQWHRWMAAEDAYVHRDAPAASADAVVPGYLATP